MKTIRDQLIEAHRRGDWEAAKRLSQEKEKAKKQPRHCVVCGVALSHARDAGRNPSRCIMHSIVHRFYARSLPAALVLLMAFTFGASLRQSITLYWTYPQSELSTNLTFNIYSSTDVGVPVPSWPLFTNVSGLSTNITVPLTPQARFFYVTASNLWGESPPSNVASTPNPPRSDSALGIR